MRIKKKTLTVDCNVMGKPTASHVMCQWEHRKHCVSHLRSDKSSASHSGILVTSKNNATITEAAPATPESSPLHQVALPNDHHTNETKMKAGMTPVPPRTILSDKRRLSGLSCDSQQIVSQQCIKHGKNKGSWELCMFLLLHDLSCLF